MHVWHWLTQTVVQEDAVDVDNTRIAAQTSQSAGTRLCVCVCVRTQYSMAYLTSPCACVCVCGYIDLQALQFTHSTQTHGDKLAWHSDFCIPELKEGLVGWLGNGKKKRLGSKWLSSEEDCKSLEDRIEMAETDSYTCTFCKDWSLKEKFSHSSQSLKLLRTWLNPKRFPANTQWGITNRTKDKAALKAGTSIRSYTANRTCRQPWDVWLRLLICSRGWIPE